MKKSHISRDARYHEQVCQINLNIIIIIIMLEIMLIHLIAMLYTKPPCPP